KCENCQASSYFILSIGLFQKTRVHKRFHSRRITPAYHYGWDFSTCGCGTGYWDIIDYCNDCRDNHHQFRDSIQTYISACFSWCAFFITCHPANGYRYRSEEHTSELQSRFDLVCRLLLEKKKIINKNTYKNDKEVY